MTHNKCCFILSLFFYTVSIAAVEDNYDDPAYLSGIGLPVMTIETVNGETPTYRVAPKRYEGAIGNSITDANKVPGSITITFKGDTVYQSGEYVEDISGMTIRVRGNTSPLVSDKKPFKIKLEKKADLLFRDNDSIYKDKNWILIRDESLKNMVGFKLNELLGMEWTPAFKYVNVIFNGKYQGLYMLLESVRRNETARINVDKTGYIFEFDPYWWNEDLFVKSGLTYLDWLPMHYTFKYPKAEEMTPAELDYFTKMIDTVEESLYDGTYPKYIDVESFARWMLGHDILGNSDGAGSNIYLSKYDNTDNSKVRMSTLWDLEGSMRRSEAWDEIHTLGVFYFHYLFDNKNDEFEETYEKIWENEGEAIFKGIESFIHEFETSDQISALGESILIDNDRWDTENESVEECVELFKDWFTNRMPWLVKNIGPVKSAIRGVTNQQETRENDYYNLTGQKVQTPRKGIYIVKGKKVIL